MYREENSFPTLFTKEGWMNHSLGKELYVLFKNVDNLDELQYLYD